MRKIPPTIAACVALAALLLGLQALAGSPGTPPDPLASETTRLFSSSNIFAAALLLCLVGIAYFLKRRLNDRVTSLSLAQQKLQSQAERLSLALDITNDGLWDWSYTSGACYFSPRWFTMLGYAPDELPATLGTWEGLLHPEDRDRIITEQAKGLAQNEEHTHEYRSQAKDGSYRWLLSRCRVVERGPGGVPLRIVGVNTDITERRQAELALQASEERFAKAFHSSPAPMVLAEIATGRLLSVNDRWVEILGRSREEQIGRTTMEIGIWADPTVRDQAVELLKSQRFFKDKPIELLTKTGQRRSVLWSAEVIRLGEQEVMLSLVFDITERKRLELDLADQLAFRQALMDTIPYAVFYKGADTRFLGFNKAYEKIFGIQREELIGKRVLDLEYLPLADRLTYQAEDEAVIANVAEVHKEMPIPFADGVVHQTLYSVNGFRQSDGSPGGLIGIIVDITERKKREGDLREVLERLDGLTKTVPVVLFELVATSDDALDNRFTYVSEKVRDVLGITPEAVIADPAAFSGLIHPADRVTFSTANIEAMHHGLAFELDFRVILGNGQVKWVHASSVPNPRRNGRPSWSGYLMDITAGKLNELALADSEQRYRTIFENTPMGIFRTTFEGRFVEANRSMATMYGYDTPAEFLADVADVGRDLYDKEADKRRLRDALLQNPKGARIETVFKRKDGSRFHAAINASLQFDAEGRPTFLDGTTEDINERKRGEEKYRVLFEASPDAIFLMKDGRFTDCNPQALELFGCAREQMIGRSASDFSPLRQPSGETSEVLSTELLRKAETGHVHGFEWQQLRCDGSHFTSEVSLNAMNLFNETYVLAFLRDVSERRKMQELMVQTEKMMSVGGLAAGMAHELNNPLGIIMQSVQNMQRRFSPSLPGNVALAQSLGLNLGLMEEYMRGRSIDEYLRGIQEAGDRAAKIIRTMLDFSRGSQSSRVSCNVSELLDTAVGLAANDYDLKRLYDFKGIRIERDYEAGMLSVTCSETEIIQVLLNIIKNAAQAMPERDDTQEPPSLSLVTRRVNGAARIEITDNGPGMDEATRKRVFEPFFTTKPQGEGTGLGLSVGFFIITQKHGGKFLVDSHPGIGTTFAIELPLE